MEDGPDAETTTVPGWAAGFAGRGGDMISGGWGMLSGVSLGRFPIGGRSRTCTKGPRDPGPVQGRRIATVTQQSGGVRWTKTGGCGPV